MNTIRVTLLNKLLVTPEFAIQLTHKQWQIVILILREAKILASYYHLLIQHKIYDQIPDHVQGHLYSAAVYAQRQAHQLAFECSELKIQLSEKNITPLFLKGAGYALRKSNNAAGRICSDIDVLVSKAQLPAAEVCLKRHHWLSEPISDYDQRYYREWAHEIPPMYHMIRSTVLDLHHNLYLPISGRANKMQLIIEQRTKVDQNFYVLNKPAAVLHCIIHLFLNEDVSSGYRDLYDLKQLFAEFGSTVFYQELSELSIKTGFSRELALALGSLQYHFDVSVPDTLIQFYEEQCASPATRLWAQRIYPVALIPRHPGITNTWGSLCRLAVFVRGHCAKMPFYLLLYHTLRKSVFGLLFKLTGKEIATGKNQCSKN